MEKEENCIHLRMRWLRKLDLVKPGGTKDKRMSPALREEEILAELDSPQTLA
jgi:hypothetical protein